MSYLFYTLTFFSFSVMMMKQIMEVYCPAGLIMPLIITDLIGIHLSDMGSLFEPTYLHGLLFKKEKSLGFFS